MDSGKLKNIALIILLIANALLLGLTAFQQMESRQYRKQALLDAVELLGRQGIQVQAQDMPREEFPQPQVLEQDPDQDQKAFTALLGADTTLTQRGLVTLYTGSNGSAEVRDDGAFAVTLAQGAYPLSDGQSLPDHSGQVLERMGFSGRAVSWDEDSVVVVETLGDTPVFSCAVTLRYADGELRSVAGTRLSGVASADAQGGTPLSTATLLVRFKTAIADSGDTCTAILDASQGYTMTADVNRKLRLTPVLRVRTDTNTYVLDAVTGALTGN